MSARACLIPFVTLALSALVVLAATRVAVHYPGSALELGRVTRIELLPELSSRLRNLRDDVLITYYVTRRQEMPSHMRRVEREVVDLLKSMRRAAGGKLDYHLIDPTEDHDLAGFAAKRGVTPVRERHVTRDAYSEQELWSTLSVAYGPRQPALIQGLGPQHLPRLQQLLLLELDQLEQPRKPVFALAAGPGFGRLEAHLAAAGEVLKVDPSAPGGLPREADLLFWMNPGAIDANTLRNLREFIDSGRAVVVAGSLREAELVTHEGRPALALTESGYDAEALLGAFGLHPVPGLLLDEKSATLRLPTGEAPARFRVACLALNQDFHSLAREPRGTLLFVAPTPIGFDNQRLGQAGWKAEVLATSSDQSSLVPFFDTPLPLDRLARAAGRQVPKQALLVWLRPVKAWHGSLVVAASSGLFRDETFEIQTLAHKRLTETLIRTLTSDERLVMTRSDLRRPEPVPLLTPGARLCWRLSTVLLLPVLLLVGLFWRRGRRRRGVPGAVSVAARVGTVVRPAGLFALVLLLAAFSPALGLRADLTAGGVNRLAGHSRELAARLTGDRSVSVQLFFSEQSRLPPELKRLPDRVRDLLREFSRAGAELKVVRTVPEDLAPGELERLGSSGVVPIQFTSRNEEVTTVRSVFSVLRLSCADRVETLQLPDPKSAENLEFRLAFAFERLLTGRPVRIAFASDAPRLSSAEAYQYYQSRGLIPPSGKDVYSLARELLSGHDFELTHVNPRDPVLPEEVDLLVWLQPRRSVTRMLEVFVEHLYRGGRALLAAQHFNIQSRQYRGTEFEFVYWPQPQSPDVESFYFPDLGVDLIREVLFDELALKIDLESQLNRFSRREFRTMNLAKPFLIRAAGENFSKDSPITRELGDQSFLFANYFRLDLQRLNDLGLRATPLITTSQKSWSLDWHGGWIPDGYLRFPPVAEGEDQEPEPVPLLGRVPLAVLLEGLFPWPRQAFQHPPLRFGPGGAAEQAEPVPDYPRPEPSARHLPGRLVMLGCSELFKDHRMTALSGEFRADHLLLNAVADLALDPGLARVLVRRAVTRGFEPVEPEQGLRWRLVVLGALPALMLLIKLLRLAFSSRPVLRIGRGKTA